MLEKMQEELLKPPMCIVGAWVDALEPTDQIIATELIYSQNVSAERLRIAFSEVGGNFGTTALKTHRRGICRCQNSKR